MLRQIPRPPPQEKGRRMLRKSPRPPPQEKQRRMPRKDPTPATAGEAASAAAPEEVNDGLEKEDAPDPAKMSEEAIS